jgi:hypothetical protein
MNLILICAFFVAAPSPSSQPLPVTQQFTAQVEPQPIPPSPIPPPPAKPLPPSPLPPPPAEPIPPAPMQPPKEKPFPPVPDPQLSEPSELPSSERPLRPEPPPPPPLPGNPPPKGGKPIPQAFEHEATQLVTGTLEELDLTRLKGLIKTDVGKLVFFKVIKPELFKGLTLGQRVAIQLDDQGRAIKVMDTPVPELTTP